MASGLARATALRNWLLFSGEGMQMQGIPHDGGIYQSDQDGTPGIDAPRNTKIAPTSALLEDSI